MKRSLLVLALLGGFVVARAEAAPIVYRATLGPEAAGATGSGETVVTYDPVAQTLRVQAVFSGLSGVTTVSHIHCCTAVPFAGTVGVATMVPTFSGFPAGVSAGSYDNTFDLLLPSSFNPAFVTANGGTPAGAEAALAAGLAAGRAYLNIHTTTFGGGEIRGFLAVPEPLTLLLLGLGVGTVAARARRR